MLLGQDGLLFAGGSLKVLSPSLAITRVRGIAIAARRAVVVDGHGDGDCTRILWA
jgi:hypothetical protein